MMYMTFDIGSGADDILLRLAGPGANLAGLAFDPPALLPPSIAQQPVGATCLVGVTFQLALPPAGPNLSPTNGIRAPIPCPTRPMPPWISPAST